MTKPPVIVEIRKTEVLTIGLDIPTVAAWFCELDDEQQADFFIKIAELAESWSSRPESQWLRIGGHLRDCCCATEQARELIRSLYFGLDGPNP